MKAKARGLLVLLSLTGLFVYAQPHGSYAQTTVQGRTLTASDSSVVPYATVILQILGSGKPLAYGQTFADGEYQLTLPAGIGAVVLKASRLGYQAYEQRILIDKAAPNPLLFNIYLEEREDVLNTVEIKAKPPILVKEDTVIYNIEQWATQSQTTLEEVLATLPGFKVLSNGEISVNGRAVYKVIIDGEEFTAAGAALLTKSLSPENVEDIEVRFNEQDEKLKESLLDTREYVVLDIKLKKELNKSFFGKLRATQGLQNKNLPPGGYANLF